MSELVNILLVEDSEADRYLFQEMLAESGNKVSITSASNGEEARDLLLSAKVAPDVIFLDINMPRMNGHEFLASSESLLRESNTAVYMLSSSGQSSDKEQTAAYPFVKGYLQKPCPPETLNSILRL
ncbi:response regulator [Eionea flava]